MGLVELSLPKGREPVLREQAAGEPFQEWFIKKIDIRRRNMLGAQAFICFQLGFEEPKRCPVGIFRPCHHGHGQHLWAKDAPGRWKRFASEFVPTTVPVVQEVLRRKPRSPSHGCKQSNQAWELGG